MGNTENSQILKDFYSKLILIFIVILVHIKTIINF